jgi:hypothetical protein
MTTETEREPIDLATVTLDINSLTLGELMALERAADQSYDELLAHKASRVVAALFVHESRTSAKPRSWRELASLRLSELSSSTSRSRPAGSRPRSPRSRSAR